MFALFYNAKEKSVRALNGSGRAGSKFALDGIKEDIRLKYGQDNAIPMSSVHSCIVPGAAAGWVDTIEKFGGGKLNLEEILKPAIQLAEEGFPVSELVSTFVCPI